MGLHKMHLEKRKGRIFRLNLLSWLCEVSWMCCSLVTCKNLCKHIRLGKWDEGLLWGCWIPQVNATLAVTLISIYSTSASSLQMKPSICILMTVCSLLINCESRENKDAWVDRRPDLAPSYVAVVFDVRQVTFSLFHPSVCPLQNYLWLVRM